MLDKAGFSENLHFGETLLPNLPFVTQLLVRPIGEVSFDHLHGLLDAHFWPDGEQDMDVVRHYNKVMHLESPGAHVRAENIDEEIGHAFGLQDGYSPAGFGSHEEGAGSIACRTEVSVA